MQELKARLERLEAHLERKPVPEGKEKIVKQEIKTYLRELQQTPSFAPPPATRDEAEEIKKFEPDQQVGALISLVFEKGLLEAISVAIPDFKRLKLNKEGLSCSYGCRL